MGKTKTGGSMKGGSMDRVRRVSRRFWAWLFGAWLWTLGLGAGYASEIYTFDPTHTNIVWFAEHFGFSSPSGKFLIKRGVLELDEDKPEQARVEVVVDTASVLTGLPKFDAHLKNADFLDVQSFPEAVFRSQRVERTGERTALVHGTLTLLGVDRPLTLDVVINKSGQHPFSKRKTVGFSAEGILKRSDWGMDWGVPGVGDYVEISIEAEASVR